MMQVRWFQIYSGCISTTITLRMTVCNEQFNIACQWLFSYCCRHSARLYDCVWLYLFFYFLSAFLANKRVHYAFDTGSGVLLQMEVGIRKGAWQRARRYPAYLWSLRWVYAVKKPRRLVYAVYPRIPPQYTTGHRAYSKRVPRTNCALRIKKCAPRISSGIYFLSTS